MLNTNLQRLCSIAQQPKKRIIGLMSGTSLDGLDIALCEISGSGLQTSVRLEQFSTVPYTDAVKAAIRKIFAKDTIAFRDMVLLNTWLADWHAHSILGCLHKWGIDAAAVDLIASHGQTVFHAPAHLHGQPGFGHATLQIADGDHIAVKTGIITLSDFRQKHIAAGGEGAPLALYGDVCLFSKPGENRVMLNMGGIANFTYLPGNGNMAEVMVTDTGPGNTLIDAYTRTYFNIDFDRDALLAMQGRVNYVLLEQLKSHDFFHRPFPKTTGPELFSLRFVQQAQLLSKTSGISHHDMLATLTRFSAETIVKALQQALGNQAGYHIYASGGGAHNPLLMHYIGELLKGVPIAGTDLLHIPGDAKEAVLFAVLANETIAGEKPGFTLPGMPAVSMGKLSFPE